MLWHVDCLEAGHVLHSDGVYMLSEMPMDIGTRALTVQEIMRMNFQAAWPSMDAFVLQVEAHHGAAMQWKELIITAGGQDYDVFLDFDVFFILSVLMSVLILI